MEWVTPGHPLFEALRRHTLARAAEGFSAGACFYSLQHHAPARLDFYRARVVDGLGQVVHERLFAVELDETGAPALREPTMIGNLLPTPLCSPGQASGAVAAPDPRPSIAPLPEPQEWLYNNALQPFLESVRRERVEEVERIADHVELALTELLQRADVEIGKASEEVGAGVPGAEGRLAQAENRHAALLARRERRRKELKQQRTLTLQDVDRITSVLVLPHPERETPDIRRMQPDPETETISMQVVMDHERTRGCQAFDVHEKNLGYDVTSLDLSSGELRLIEVKGLKGAKGTILLTPNERRVAEDRRDCYWLYVVTDCGTKPVLQEPIRDPARFPWHEVIKVQHYWLEVDALTQPMRVHEPGTGYGEES